MSFRPMGRCGRLMMCFCRGVFPKNFRSDSILIYLEFPDCIVFRGDETSPRSLVYTRDGKRPDDLIAKRQSLNTCVRVEKLAHGWYDVCPFQF